MVLTSYALNEQELAVVRGEIERDALREVIGVVAGGAAGAKGISPVSPGSGVTGGDGTVGNAGNDGVKYDLLITQ